MEEGDAAYEDGWTELLHGIFHDSNRAGCLLLDEVFANFFRTNTFRGQRLSLHDVLHSNSKRYVSFSHADVPWRATIHQRAESDDDIVLLQLPNNGFVYKPVGLEGKTYSRHKSNTWRSLPANLALRNFPTIAAFCSRQYTEGIVYYNHDTQRVDMQLFPPAGSDNPVFEIFFEPAYPEQRAQWQPVFR